MNPIPNRVGIVEAPIRAVHLLGTHGLDRRVVDQAGTPSISPMVAAYMRARLRAVVIPFAAGISVAWTAATVESALDRRHRSAQSCSA